MSPHSFVLADSFDAMPLHLYDTVEAFTAPTLEPEVFNFDTCLHCDDLRIIEAVNQYHQDVLAPCPHCEGGKVEKLSRDNNQSPKCSREHFSRRRENSSREEYQFQKLSRDNKPRFNMPAIYLHLYSKMPEDKLTIWERKHRDSLLKAA